MWENFDREFPGRFLAAKRDPVNFLSEMGEPGEVGGGNFSPAREPDPIACGFRNPCAIAITDSPEGSAFRKPPGQRSP
ncbi:hypothetical protein [Phormidium sp. CCY1219]|uniref:hypothetical protein n=1 Tax=Phormidium sp. CCY1219 TaxID=2886104 RepID=UPI002D1EF2D9|nr:hypothetical protein [Phormidium sp. CCY1219]MEB3827886.1 hypothetical protein [Phormidium sp. CCY1219]